MAKRERHPVGATESLTEVGGIVVGRALQAHAAEKHDRVLGRALVGASTRAQDVDQVEQIVDVGRRLVDRAHDGPTLISQTAQQLDGVEGGGAVQSAMGDQEKDHEVRFKVGMCQSGTGFEDNGPLTHVVGSSKNNTAGLSISSRAMDRRFFWPPLRLEHFVCRAFVSLSEFSK